ncbi:hypothetical protein TUBRATIS_30690, partial [Tubulinosema ratisbonensis]
ELNSISLKENYNIIILSFLIPILLIIMIYRETTILVSYLKSTFKKQILSVFNYLCFQSFILLLAYFTLVYYFYRLKNFYYVLISIGIYLIFGIFIPAIYLKRKVKNELMIRDLSLYLVFKSNFLIYCLFYIFLDYFMNTLKLRVFYDITFVGRIYE